MLNKKIYISRHCLKRFEERGIRISQKRNTIIAQIIRDLRPLNIRIIEKLPTENEHKIITRQGKVYVVLETETQLIVKTVYKIDLRYKTKYASTGGYVANDK